MTMPSYYRWLEVEQVGEVTAVRFTARTILGDEAVIAISDQLLGLVGSAGCRQFVLNLTRVESLSTSMVGRLVALNRHIEAAGGRVVLCGLGPFLLEIFKVLNLHKLGPVYADEAEALRSFTPAGAGAEAVADDTSASPFPPPP
jgi:anti-sigma B factor antagonist